ncbi:hypothetical protein A1O1_07953 [Capronia coronata CBS 617.96]|uniref:Rhodopsin domain-containing protein n=1 Tax=Capronia coronata CBS 617.96 TaxID=1182541 RepID=W9XNW8_9EURO|nr:uncharacterized protein A1O1_07953 [Capronia coronata CBS 617.96]EXJ81888.1 hypothetical protein A1O1_07953 [Capronia coronata CBS 617.96]
MDYGVAGLAAKPGFIPEAWTLYGVGVICIFARLAGKIRHTGYRHLDLDDAFIAFGLVWYTLLCVSLYKIAVGDGCNLMTKEELQGLTPESKADRVRGSKWVFVSQHAMVLTIWSMKAAMLVLYARITDGIRQRRSLWALTIWVVCAFLGDELSLFLICSPLSQYWAVPPQNPQCATYRDYQIINAVLNISSDVLILAFGVPPVMKARVSIQQRFVLGFIFGMGLFVIAAAITRAVYCIAPSLASYVYMYWYFREASVAVYVACLPGIWVFLRKIFPMLQRFTSRNGTKKTASHSDSNLPPRRHPSRPRNPWDTENLDFDSDNFPPGKCTVADFNIDSPQWPADHGSALDVTDHETKPEVSYTGGEGTEAKR